MSDLNAFMAEKFIVKILSLAMLSSTKWHVPSIIMFLEWSFKKLNLVSFNFFFAWEDIVVHCDFVYLRILKMKTLQC